MTPLAMKIARELTLPIKRRTFHNQDVLALFTGDMHCFDVSAITKPISDAMDESNVWPDVASLLDTLFLPSPVTWLESLHGGNRIAYALTKDGPWWRIYMALDGKRVVGGKTAKFRPCSIIQDPEMIEVVQEFEDNPITEMLETKPEEGRSVMDLLRAGAYQDGFLHGRDKGVGIYGRERLEMAEVRRNLLGFELDAAQKDLVETEGQIEMLRLCKTGIAFSALAIDLINTPGLVGFRQHAPHAAFAKQFARLTVGKYPLRSWSEVTVKTHTTHCDGDYQSGATYRKCLHFVRSHQRHYRNGRVTVIPAHWRGDPALGIKRTRYRVAA